MKQNSEHDYTLEGMGCWVNVGNVSILIRRTETRVYITCYRAGREAEGQLAQCYAPFIDKGMRE